MRRRFGRVERLERPEKNLGMEKKEDPWEAAARRLGCLDYKDDPDINYDAPMRTRKK